MNNEQSITIRIPRELKRRLEREADYQGVSLNDLTNYLLTLQLAQMESISLLENRLAQKDPAILKKKVTKILERVPDREVSSWDAIG